MGEELVLTEIVCRDEKSVDSLSNKDLIKDLMKTVKMYNSVRIRLIHCFKKATGEDECVLAANDLSNEVMTKINQYNDLLVREIGKRMGLSFDEINKIRDDAYEEVRF